MTAAPNRSTATSWIADHEAFFSCHGLGQQGWLPFREIRLPIDDIGFRQAVTAVERMRTYAGHPFDIQSHLLRWGATLTHLRIDGMPDEPVMRDHIAELVRRNRHRWTPDGDVGITLWATPGDGSAASSGPPTWALHLNRIDPAIIRRRQQDGQPIVVTEVQQPPDQSWSRQAKVRCRLHYYLADQAARRRDPDATGLLIDADGTITESSTANVAIVVGDSIVSPLPEQVLAGVTQRNIESIAKNLGVDWKYERITPQALGDATEILLMGTGAGLWFGNRVLGCRNDHIFSTELIRGIQRQFDARVHFEARKDSPNA